MTPEIIAILTSTVLPAIGAFVVGHFHLFLKPSTPAQPTVPTLPQSPTIRPIGQGGIIDMFAILMAHILSGAGTPESKIAVVTKIAEAQNILSK